MRLKALTKKNRQPPGDIFLLEKENGLFIKSNFYTHEVQTLFFQALSVVLLSSLLIVYFYFILPSSEWDFFLCIFYGILGLVFIITFPLWRVIFLVNFKRISFDLTEEKWVIKEGVLFKKKYILNPANIKAIDTYRTKTSLPQILLDSLQPVCNNLFLKIELEQPKKTILIAKQLPYEQLEYIVNLLDMLHSKILIKDDDLSRHLLD